MPGQTSSVLARFGVHSQTCTSVCVCVCEVKVVTEMCVFPPPPPPPPTPSQKIYLTEILPNVSLLNSGGLKFYLLYKLLAELKVYY